MDKELFLRENQIEKLIDGNSFALVSDAISVYGEKVGYMEREPVIGNFSGWIFYSGTEELAYRADAENFEYLQLNYVCNCDPSILSILGAPAGSKYYKDHSGNFILFDTTEENDDAGLRKSRNLYQ